MAQIKTVTTTSGENTITFDSFFPYVWIRNSGEGDITAANYSGASAGDIDTVSVKAGEIAMIQAATASVYIIGATTVELHAQGFAECPFKRVAKGGEQITVTPLSVTQNGTYTAPTGTAYSPVTVDVQEQPWQPLEDGYSNFWVNIPNDQKTLILNLYSKNANAIIDWGDGTGEVALDTLTPTHTYAKAGKYVVKVKGVTGIGQLSTPVGASFFTDVFEYVELSSEIVTAVSYIFRYAVSLKNISYPTSFIFGSGAFQYCGLLTSFEVDYETIASNQFHQCYSLRSVTLNSGVTTIGATAFGSCASLPAITIPSAVTSIANYAFRYCLSLSEIHIQSTTPPSLGAEVFGGVPSDFVIYVPVGTGDTYKAAAGWSTYADHILEEGQSVTRAMQRKFAKEAKALEDAGDMR